MLYFPTLIDTRIENELNVQIPTTRSISNAAIYTVQINKLYNAVPVQITLSGGPKS